MEIRLMDKNPKTGKFLNIEIYTKHEFDILLYENIRKALLEMTLWQRIKAEFDESTKKAIKNIFNVFKERLKDNRN